jgi:hypothetical protein
MNPDDRVVCPIELDGSGQATAANRMATFLYIQVPRRPETKEL